MAQRRCDELLQSRDIDTRLEVGRAAVGVLSAWWVQVTALVVSFFVTPVLVGALGPRDYGLWSFVMAITGYYGLVNMGIGKANSKYLAEYEALGKQDEVARVVSTGFFLFSGLAAIVMLLGATVAWLLPYIRRLANADPTTVRTVVLLLAGRSAVELVTQPFRASIYAKRYFGLQNAFVAADVAATGVLGAAAVSWGGGLPALACSTLAVTLVVALLRVWCAVYLLRTPVPSWRNASKATAKRHLSFGTYEVLIQLSRNFMTYGGSIVLGLFSGAAAVGQYSVAESLVRRAVNLGKGINSVIMPYATEFEAKGDRYRLRRMLLLTTRLGLSLGTLIALVVWLLSEPFFRHWLGEEMGGPVYGVARLLAVAVAFRLAGNGYRAMLTGMGRMRVLTVVFAGEALVTLLLGVLFALRLDAAGMALAAVAGQAVGSFLCLAVYASGLVGVRFTRFVFSGVVPALATGAASGLICMLLSWAYSPTNVWTSLARMALSGCAGLGFIYTIALEPALRDKILAGLGLPLRRLAPR